MAKGAPSLHQQMTPETVDPALEGTARGAVTDGEEGGQVAREVRASSLFDTFRRPWHLK